MAQYRVKDPQGQEHIIDGPEGATPDEVMAQAQSLISSNEPSYLEKTASNVIPDIKGMITGLMGTVKEGSFDMPGRALATGIQMAGGVPYAQTPSGQTDAEFIKNAPAMGAQMVRPVTHPISYLQEHPVQQALNVLGVGQLAARGVGAALNATPFTENIVPTVERVANNQTLKGFGGTMGQLKQMAQGRGGMDALDEAARFAREKGLSDVFTTDIGRQKLLDNLLEKSGQTVGNLRQEAGGAPSGMINKLLSNPKSNINEYLGEGLASGELPTVDKALSDIQRIGGENPTHAKLAEAATYINKHAAGNKLYQPVTAATDIANALSDENNQAIAQTLGSDKAQQYVSALDEQHKLNPLEHLQQKGELRQAGGRGGIGIQFVQKLADEFGYRLTAKAATALHDSLVNNGLPITKAAIAGKLANMASPQAPSIVDLIGQLKQKYDSRRKF